MFDKFQPISLAGQADYNRHLALCSQKSSDYSFVNLWGWAQEYGLEWSWGPDYVLLRQTKPELMYWAPIGDWSTIDWSVLQSLMPENSWFIRIPEALKVLWTSRLPGVVVQESRDHWDYLYTVEDLTSLRGRKFHSKKNLLNQFIRNNDYQFITLDEKTVEQALIMQTEWLLWRNSENDATLNAENQAIVKVFHDWAQLEGLMGGGLIVEDKMIAYTVAEILDEHSIVIHFEKGCPQYKGVYQAINQIFLHQACQDFQIVNREQDLGDQGLRRAKLSYNPVGFLKKYKVQL